MRSAVSQFENHPLHPGEGTPLFIPGGILREPAQLEPFMQIEDSLAAPLLTLGGFTVPKWEGNARPGEVDHAYYPELGMFGNARNFPNPGEEGILALKEPIRRLTEIGIKTIIQVTNLPHERPTEVIPRLVAIATEVEPTAIEVNLSCHNGKKADGSLHDPICNNPDASGEVMELARIKGGHEICLGAKDSPHVTSLENEVDETAIEQLVAAISPYINFLTGVNSIGNQSFPEITCTGGKGGMSGPVLAPIAKQHLRLWRKHAPNIAYLSCGGIDSSNVQAETEERLAEDAIRIGGGQEFYRAARPHLLAARWAIAIA